MIVHAVISSLEHPAAVFFSSPARASRGKSKVNDEYNVSKRKLGYFSYLFEVATWLERKKRF